MTAGIKANVDGSGAIQVSGSDYITISSAGAVTIPQTLAVTGATTLPTIKSSTVATPPTIQDSAGTQIGTFCRAWVNFNGGTVTSPASMTGVRGSFNVSSVLDNGTGDQTVNFTTAMSDANYAAVAGGSTPGTRSNQVGTKYNQSASSCQILTYSPTGTSVDATEISLAIFR